jgi:hypothetical protein
MLRALGRTSLAELLFCLDGGEGIGNSCKDCMPIRFST